MDGALAIFTDPCGIEVSSIYVNEGKWKVCGNKTLSNDSIHTFTLDSEGNEVDITPDLDLCQGTDMAVCDGDTYVLGSEYCGVDYNTWEDIYKSHIWKNGEPIEGYELHSPLNFTFWSVAVARY